MVVTFNFDVVCLCGTNVNVTPKKRLIYQKRLRTRHAVSLLERYRKQLTFRSGNRCVDYCSFSNI